MNGAHKLIGIVFDRMTESGWPRRIGNACFGFPIVQPNQQNVESVPVGGQKAGGIEQLLENLVKRAQI